MFRPSKKAEHDNSLTRFIEMFNGAHPQDITAKMWLVEQYVYDGVIDLWGLEIKYDWEKRDGWEGDEFPFDTLGQFERKFDSEKEIQLTIQSNRDETYFAVAWHKDFDEVTDVLRTTNYKYEEAGRMRTTRKFTVFSYGNMNQFKRWLLR